MPIKVVSASGTPQLVDSNLLETDKAIRTGFETYLPWAARELHISSDPKDYFLAMTPIMWSDLPNRNGVAFPLSELVKWNVSRGCQAYMGWKGMPMYEEHQSDDHKTALGIVIDVTLRPIRGFCGDKLWKIICLAAVDRTKNRRLAEKFEAGKMNSFSMGAMVEGYACGYCGALMGECSHLHPEKPLDFYELNGRLVYRTVYGVSPYELSCVEDPAYASALTDQIMRY